MARNIMAAGSIAGLVLLSLTGCSFFQDAADKLGVEALHELSTAGLEGVVAVGEPAGFPNVPRATQSFRFENEACTIDGYVEAGGTNMFTATIWSADDWTKPSSFDHVTLRDLTGEAAFQRCID